MQTINLIVVDIMELLVMELNGNGELIFINILHLYRTRKEEPVYGVKCDATQMWKLNC